jgi:2-desacetyl-2-hydroxyethyl bacteriochlorophyllide A dehydrogenase
VTRGTAIVFAGLNHLELRAIRLPELEPDEVLVETRLTALSQGTDRAMLAGTYRGVEDRFPFIYGYSRVGAVLEVGSEVRSFAAGDLVFVGMAGTRLDPADGLGEQGGTYTSHGVVHESDIVPLPDGLDPSVAAIGAIAAIAYQGVVAADVRANQRVLVAGLGAVGQFSALFSRLRGAEVWGMDPIASRREVAQRLSGTRPLDPGDDVAAAIEATGWGTRPWPGRNGPPTARYEQRRWAGAGGVVDVVIDATGRPDAFEAYLPLLVREGTLCLQGYYAQPLTLDFHAAHLKRLAIRTPGGLDQVDYETVLRLMTQSDVRQLIGRVIPLATVPTALPELLLRPPSDVICALVDWTAGGSQP